MTNEEIAAGLAAAFPELRIEPLAVIDVGFGSTVVETADEIIFRIARHARATRGHGYEAKLLPQLQGRLPVAVPDPRWRIEPNAAFPFGVLGHLKIPGAPLDPGGADETLAAEVAHFLEALHGLDGVEARRAEIQHLSELRDATSDALRRMLTRREYARVEAWWEEIAADERLSSYEARLRHGDFWYENMLVAEGGLVGVVDWGTAAYGDPAEDFATLRLISDDFVRATLAHYPHADEAFHGRMDRHWESVEFGGIALSLELGDDAELADAVRKLRAGPVLGAE